MKDDSYLCLIAERKLDPVVVDLVHIDSYILMRQDHKMGGGGVA